MNKNKVYSYFFIINKSYKFKYIISKYLYFKYYIILYIQIASIISILYITILQLLFNKRLAFY